MTFELESRDNPKPSLRERQLRSSEFVFPFEPKSICAAFTRACQILGIENLRFHDMRHEATSRLFECELPQTASNADEIIEDGQAPDPNRAA